MKALVLVACLTALGCSRFERVSECRSLVATVNQGMDVIEPIAKGPEKPEKYEKLAHEYRELAARVRALPLASGALKEEIKEYADLLKSTSETCVNLKNALAAYGKAEPYRRELERTTRRERLSVNKLETYCQAP